MFSLSGYLNMAAVRERITFTLEDVLELVGEENTPNSLDFDSSESELEDDVVPAISAEVNDIIDENPESAGEESDSSAESEGDRRETIRNQRQERSRQLRQRTANAHQANRGGRRGRGPRKARGARVARQAREIQDGGQQYVWSEEANRRTLKQFINAVGPAARGERRQKSFGILRAIH